jgi:hypothetical protein
MQAEIATAHSLMPTFGELAGQGAASDSARLDEIPAP